MAGRGSVSMSSCGNVFDIRFTAVGIEDSACGGDPGRAGCGCVGAGPRWFRSKVPLGLGCCLLSFRSVGKLLEVSVMICAFSFFIALFVKPRGCDFRLSGRRTGASLMFSLSI